MANNRKQTSDFSDRALEMIMRDVLSSMQECLLETAYRNSKEADFEIIEIHPPRNSERTSTATEEEGSSNAAVLNFPSRSQGYG